MKYFMVAPNHDVDSLVSHVVSEIWQPEIEHRFQEYKHEDTPFRTIPITNNQTILMADLGYSDSESNQEMVKYLVKLREAGTTIDFFDQHDWPEEVKEAAFDNYFYSDRMSSAELMARSLKPESQVSLYLSGLATKDDYNRPDQDTENLCDLVNSSYPKEQLIHELAGLHFPSLDLSEGASVALANYRLSRSNAFESLGGSYEEHDTNLGPIVTGLAPNMLYMKPGHRKIRDDNPKKSVICFYEELQNCTFRTQTSDQMSKLLTKFKGGGRGNEGGFDPGEVVNIENYESVKNSIIKAINEIYV